jgi:dTDP-4-dehydrorhamnose 3,5-epimerase|tara:strand:+ start:520 stop:1077 length:558 start_codon:yes stop_codon:yes gene_type:complete
MIKIVKSFFNGQVKLLELEKYTDKRGYFVESYNYKDLKKIGISKSFLQDNESFSKNIGTLRGLHIQKYPMQQSKLISVKRGSIFDVFVDMRKDSKTFGKYLKVVLKERDNYVLYLPYNFAHGFCTLKNNTLVNYKTSNYYSPKDEVTIKFDDSILNIEWPKVLNTKYLSIKDKNGKSIDELNKFK